VGFGDIIGVYMALFTEEVFNPIDLMAECFQKLERESFVKVHISKLETTSVSWCEEVFPKSLLR